MSTLSSFCRRAALVITANHVQVYNIDDAGDNQVQFSMYLLVTSQQVLSGSALRNSVEVSGSTIVCMYIIIWSIKMCQAMHQLYSH